MAFKRLRFHLEMEDGVEARTIDELREHFSMERVLLYYSDGRLLKWLRNNYLDEEAEAISELDPNDTELNRKICEILDVGYDKATKVSIEEVTGNKQRFAKLKDYTSDKRFYDVIDRIAFDQSELEKLLDKGTKEIYLCGDRFNIPLDKDGISYIGVNETTAVIDSEKSVDFKAKGICFQNVKFDEKYLRTLEDERINADFSVPIKEWFEPPIKKIKECLDITYSLSEKKAEKIDSYLKEGYVHYSFFIIDYKYDRRYENEEYKTYRDINKIIYRRRNLISIIIDNLKYMKKVKNIQMSRENLMYYAERKAADKGKDYFLAQKPEEIVCFDLIEYSGLVLFNLDNSEENVVSEFKRKITSDASYHSTIDTDRMVEDFKKNDMKRIYSEDIKRLLDYYSGLTNSIKIGVFLPKEIDEKIMSIGISTHFDDCYGLIVPFDYIKDILSDKNVFLIIEHKLRSEHYGRLNEFSLYRDTVTGNAWLMDQFPSFEL